MEIGTKIRKLATRCINDFDLIAAGDRILVAVSGGKDSTILYLTLQAMQRISPVPFEIHGLLIDQKQPGFNAARYLEWMASRGCELTLLEEDTYRVVTAKTAPGKSFCGLCSRLRRGILYSYAQAHGFSKVALGHHRDDINETLLMNLFYGGQLATMPPRVKAKGKAVTVIRPLSYVAEASLLKYAAELKIPTIPCNLCSNQEGMVRMRVKGLLQGLYRERPEIGASILGSLSNVKISHLLDRTLSRKKPRIPIESPISNFQSRTTFEN